MDRNLENSITFRDGIVSKTIACVSLGYNDFHGPSDGDLVFPDGVTPPSESEIEKEKSRLQAEYDAQAYSRKREAEYPSIQECVHAILDDDLVALQEKRQAVKTKYPKS